MIYIKSYVSLLHKDSSVSKAVIPRLQPQEQSGHMSPNKSTKVSLSQQPVISPKRKKGTNLWNKNGINYRD